MFPAPEASTLTVVTRLSYEARWYCVVGHTCGAVSLTEARFQFKAANSRVVKDVGVGYLNWNLCVV